MNSEPQSPYAYGSFAVAGQPDKDSVGHRNDVGLLSRIGVSELVGRALSNILRKNILSCL